MQLARLPLALAAAVLMSRPALAGEFPIGQPQASAGMEIGAVYLQPIRMEPEDMMRKPETSDIHLEADIHALKGNPNGFKEGSWIPHLGIEFELVKLGTADKVSGHLMPMVASDGPHYGDNVKLMGPGRYRLTLRISPPGAMGAHFGRHTDRETGVAVWFKPFELSYGFTFAGTGKKGGY